MKPYQKPAELYDGLRLHQNENTGGCSPRVLEALRSLRAGDVSVYPPYSAAIDACARHFGVAADSIALVNGLDEGLMGIAIAYLRSSAGGFVPEAIIPQPAFEIFAFNTEVVGGRVMNVEPNPDFSFPLDRLREEMLWLALRRLLRGPLDARWAIQLGATAALVAFLFHGFADYFLFSTPMYTVFWFLLAVVSGQWSVVSKPATTDHRPLTTDH